jgi:tetratricopeptide (TPR) repeat protein
MYREATPKLVIVSFLIACLIAGCAKRLPTHQTLWGMNYHVRQPGSVTSAPTLTMMNLGQPESPLPPLPEQVAADAEFAKGDFADAEIGYRKLISSTPRNRPANISRLTQLLEGEGRYSEAASSYADLTVNYILKSQDVHDIPTNEQMSRYKDLLVEAGGHAALAAGFDPIRDFKFINMSNDPLKDDSTTRYSMRELNAFGLTDEDIIDYRLARNYNPADPLENAKAVQILQRVLSHYPRFYEAWMNLTSRTADKDTFDVGEREYLAADPAHRLVMKKRYWLDFAKLDREVNPTP